MLAPTGSVPTLQAIGGPAAHEPWSGVAETSVRPAGSVSVTLTFVATDGPLFLTTTVQVIVPPATAVAGPCLVTSRSLDGPTSVVAVAVLSVGSPSPWSPVTVAVFTRVLSASAIGAVPWIVSVTDASTASAPTGQVTVPAGLRAGSCRR